MISEANHISHVYDQFIDLQPGHYHSILYSTVETHSLKWPYDTNCRDYAKEQKHDKSMKECSYYCLRWHLLHTLNMTCVPPLLMGIKEEELFDSGQRVPICFERVNNPSCDFRERQCKGMLNVFKYCMSTCQPECYKREYELTIKTWPIIQDSNLTVISVGPKFGKYRKNEMEAVVSLQKLFADLGGLGGLYVGFNILIIFESISHLLFG